MGKGKGCDIGYAPVSRSCEGAEHVATCTVAALGAITAFAVPAPATSRKACRLPGCPASRPAGANHPAYFGLAKLLGPPTLSAVDGGHTSRGRLNVKSQELCKRNFLAGAPRTKASCGKMWDLALGKVVVERNIHRIFTLDARGEIAHCERKGS